MSSLPLLTSVHLWTSREDLLVHESDLDAFRCHDKQQAQLQMQQNVRLQDKLRYGELRGQRLLVESKGLKQNLREFESLLIDLNVIFESWRTSELRQVLFSNGTLVNVRVGPQCDIRSVSVDKSLCGKLLEPATHAQFTAKTLILAYQESKVTVIRFGRGLNFASDESLDKYEPKLEHADLFESGDERDRKLKRKLVLSPNEDSFLIWWNSEQEVFPWQPNMREENRANVMLFSLSQRRIKRLGYLRTLSDPIEFRFITQMSQQQQQHQCLVHFLGQSSTNRKRGEVQVENAFIYPVDGDRQLRRKKPPNANKLILPGGIVALDFVSANLVLLGCSDGSLLVLDCMTGTLDLQAQAAFIPQLIKVHQGDQTLFLAVGEKGHAQFFDVALNPIQLVIDLSQYFRAQVSVVSAEFASSSNNNSGSNNPNVNTVTVRFHGGPIAVIKLEAGVLSSGSLGPLQITAEYLKQRQFRPAIMLLNRLDWNTQSTLIMTCLGTIFTRLMRAKYSPEIEVCLEMCLGLFYSPNKSISEEVIDECSEQIHDLSRKFFHFLLRHRQLAKAFQLAVDINDYDLFMDVYHSANNTFNAADLASAALIKARCVFFEEEQQQQQHQQQQQEAEEEQPAEVIPHLPSPMQLFSTATVDKPAAAATGDKGDPVTLNATYAKTTSAKNIQTTEFVPATDQQQQQQQQQQQRHDLRYDSIVSLPKLHLNAEAENVDDIKVVHFGLV